MDYIIDTLGVNVNVQNTKTAITPLSLAASFHQYSSVEYLIRKGADVNAVDNNGATPLNHAGSFNDPKLIQLLLVLDYISRFYCNIVTTF
jgi:ankyrin repeat protein